jgi:TRAP-type C4-dicarboxylate transport system permease small subunit
MERSEVRPQSQAGALFRRVNDQIARAESAVATGMLLLMLVVAFTQALLRNLTQYGIQWANAALEYLDWGDFVLQKGTLWLAFLGASLAVHADKHVAIDIVPRYIGPKGRVILRGLVGVLGATICWYLSRAFLQAIIINGAERPAAVEVFTDTGAVHICEATAAELAVGGYTTGPFCYVRGFIKLFGLTMETPGAAFQLIVPVMLFVMMMRMFATGVFEFVRYSRGDFSEGPGAHGLAATATDLGHDTVEPKP